MTKSSSNFGSRAGTAPEIAAQKQKFSALRLFKEWSGPLTFLFVVGGFAAEVFAPPDYRPSTFYAARDGNKRSLTAEIAAPGETKAAVMIDTGKGKVEFAKTCKINLKDMGRNLFNTCLHQKQGNHAICTLEEEIFLASQTCPDWEEFPVPKE